MINDFVEKQLPKRAYASHAMEEENPKARWIHEHPTTMKVARQSVTLTGLGIVAHGAYTSSLPEFVAGVAIGSVGAAAGWIAAKAMDIFTPLKRVSSQAFSPGSCSGGELKYEGDLPVLEITTENAFQAGWAQGKLMAPQINAVQAQSELILHRLHGMPRANEISLVIAAVRGLTPQLYLDEMRGVVSGYNSARPSGTKALTEDDLMLLHLLPEKVHMDAGQVNKWVRREKPLWTGRSFEPMACTVVVDGNSKTGPVFGRNLDWPSLGVYGTNSFILRRHLPDGSTVDSLSIPGLVGVLTGMRSDGLALAMNVCVGQTENIEGLPALFFNRKCLEECKTVSDVKELLSKERPLGPYHLSVADREDAMSVHLFQDEGKHKFRKWSKDTPLITTNFRYGKLGRTTPTMSNSAERETVLEQYFADIGSFGSREAADMPNVVDKALNLPHVNNIRTIHQVIMQPLAGSMTVKFDNGWAGDQDALEVY